MNKLSLMLRFLKGSRLTYTGALLAVMGNVLISASIPLLIRLTLDSIFADEPLALPAFLEGAFNKIGGVELVRQNMWLLLVLMVALTALQGLMQFVRTKLSSLTGENSAKRMRDRAYLHILRQPYDYHVKSQTGDIIQRCTSDIETAQHFVANRSVEAISIVLQVIVVLFILLSTHALFTLVSVLLIPIVLVMTVRFFRSMMTLFLETDESEGAMSTTLQENLTGVRVVKAFAAQQFEIDKFTKASSLYRDNIMKITRLMANFWAGSDLLCMLQLVIVVIFGTWLLVQGTITLGIMVAFTSYAGMLIWPIRGLGQMMGFMGQAFVALTRIQEILDHAEEDYTTGDHELAIRGEIDFCQVRFGYSKSRPVLDDLSFTIPAGSTTAVLGATGSGKSTLAHLLLRLYDYQDGSIRIDGKELKEISRAWIRQHIGLVLQEPFLFSRNIRENIRLGRPDAGEEELRAAAQIASVDDAISEFEDGYDTLVGERGVTLSGGQRQRVAIARTILREVPILIFDDSLSAVDTETDAAIRAALQKRRRGTTTLIISHRITTLAEADQILVLDEGRIVQRGNHAELVKQPGHYRQIWQIQSSTEADLG